MASVLWVSLPRNWQLTEVQAGLQVCIAVLCTWGIFAFSRFCWQLSSNLVRKNRAVALSSLMSITTIGEAFDVIALLKRRIFRVRYWKLLAQSIVVISLTVATIVSGPIAKASTRMGTIVKQITIPGLLATSHFNSRTYANVDWNRTYNSIEQAGFPLTQLLDYMPQYNSSWVYQPSEWPNSTWTMDCVKTNTTPVTIVDTGVCGNMSVELPATNDFFPYDDYDWWQYDYNALFTNSTYLSDALVFFTGWTYPGFDSTTNKTYNMTTSVVALHLHGGTKKPADSTNTCDFGMGPIEASTYTKMDCTLTRPRTIPNEYFRAFPDCGDFWALSQAYKGNYFDRFASESNQNIPITMVQPDELIRFYQTYLITKDYQEPIAVDRQLTADIRVVQLSSTFIAFGSLYALAVILGLFNYGIFAYKNRDVIRTTPESKLDWVVQSILDENEAQMGHNRNSRRSVVATSIRELAAQGTEKVRTMFENAKYGQATPGSAEENPFGDHSATHPLSQTQSHAGSEASSLYGQAMSPPPPQPHPQGYGFTMGPMTPQPYTGYPGGDYNTSSNNYSTSFNNYNVGPYENAYATQPQPADFNSQHTQPLQSPQGIFQLDRRPGYQRLG